MYLQCNAACVYRKEILYENLWLLSQQFHTSVLSTKNIASWYSLLQGDR